MAGALTIAEPVIDWRPQARRDIFHLKTDPPFADHELQALRARVQAEALSCIPQVEAAAAEAGFAGKASLLAVGTYHVAFRLTRADVPAVVMRSAVSGLFADDRSLLLDGWVRRWLAPIADAPSVPNTLTVQFAHAGAPFDFAIMDEAPGTPLRDEMLDANPALLAGIGRALRAVHAVAGEGAGLLDLSLEQPAQPRGVHARWEDYLYLNLDRHIDACRKAQLIDAQLAATIVGLLDTMRGAFADRPMRLLHGDPGTHNLAVDADKGGVTALLDWEDALVGDPLFDVAMWSTFHPPRRLADFLVGYGLAAPSRAERQLIAAYFLRIALSKTVHRLRFGIADRPDRSPGHHRIRRGVEELESLLR